MRLVRERDSAVVVEDLEDAHSFTARFLGLMGRRRLAPGAGLWLEPCNSIHMAFMRFAIDVLFLSGGRSGKRLQDGDAAEVVAVKAGVRPWIGMAWCSKASSTLELPAGRAASCDVRVGDRLRVEVRR